MDVERVLRNTAATISVTFYNGSTAVEADGTVTVVIKRADGTTLLASTPATNDPAVGVYSIVLPPQSALNLLTLTWTGTFTGTTISIESTVEIVGGFYFSIAELRNSDSALTLTRFSNQALIDARLSVESEFEDICHRAFVPRFQAEYVSGEYSNELWLTQPEPIRITKLSYGATVYDTTTWESAGYLRRDQAALHRIVLSGSALSVSYLQDMYIEYEYGMTRTPVLIKEKALRRAKLNLLGMASTIDPRATTMILPDIGSVNLATPGMRGLETGIPDIDVVLRRYTLDAGGVF